MFQTETSFECRDSDTDTLHISLSCMVYTLDAVDVVMEFTLDNRLEVRLHVLSSYFYYVSDAVLASKFHLIYFWTNHCNLMVFYFRKLTCLYKLCTVYAGTIKLNLHFFTTDDLTFKCRCECYRNVDVCNLNLDITSFKRSSVEFADIFLNDQALRYTEDILCLVCNYRESKCDCACSTSYDYVIQRCKCIYECRYTLECVFHQVCSISRCNVTEDQSCS